MKYWKPLATILLFAYCLYYASSLDSWHLIDTVDLLIHEAGHVVFSIFGELLYVLGGSLLQIIVPIIFTAYFVFRNQKHSASLLLSWVGINFLNVSVYAGDALRMQLPLLTGDTESHDWNQILFRLGWLHHTVLISRTLFVIGVLLILISFAWGCYISYKEFKREGEALVPTLPEIQ